MKPIRLEMTAFGSYAERTVIPFSELRQNLYLITGDTGAGKTTIFDAIMFALYGVASGRERDKNEMLHCDRAPKSEDTVVQLTFTHNGKVCQAERRLHFKRKGSQYILDTPKATLLEQGREPLSGQAAVTRRCTELLGLNADQFRKIIMLAQGEFREFLKADSEKKGDILDKLFDNSASLYFQNLFNEARKRLERERKDILDRLETLLGKDSFILPDGESREPYLSERADLLENLTALVNSDEARITDCQARLDALQVQLDGLNRRHGEAVPVNQQFDELETLRQRLDELESQRAEMRQRQEALKNAEDAFHKVSPLLEKRRTAEKALDDTQDEIASLRGTLEEQETALRIARERVEADTKTQEELKRIYAAIQRIEQDLLQYEKLERYQTERRDAEEAAADAKREKDAQQTACDELTDEIQRLKSELESLDSVESEIMRCERDYQQAEERLDRLCGENGIQREVDAICVMEEEYSFASNALIALTQAASEAGTRHLNLYHRFIVGQAGLLADELRKEVGQAGAARCPVCGSDVCQERIPYFAPLSAETPTREAVEAARRDAETREKRRSEKKTEADTILADIHAKKDALSKRMREALPDCDSWECLISNGYLSGAIRQAEEVKRGAESSLNAARKRAQEKRRLRARLPQREAALEEARELLKVSESAEREQSERAYQAKAHIDALRNNLKYPDNETAHQVKRTLEEKRDALEQELNAHIAARDFAQTERDTTAGILQEKETSVAKLERDFEEALKNQEAVLTETGLASLEAVEIALRPIGNQDSEEWLRLQRKAVTDFKNEEANVNKRILELEERTHEKARIDLTALETEIAEVRAAYQTLNTGLINQRHLHLNHRDILKQAQKAKRKLAAVEPARNRLNQLALLAVGSSGEGGKLSFARYVMGTIFKEILEMANQRLEVMSGGRYALVHKIEAGRKNAAAGMEIEVLDMSVDQQRPSASLSGGEAFFTSLALALGLSDVVQNRAGGKPMDALFIDEGFGSLSDGALDKTLETLQRLTEGNRLVGVISHVDRLSESIPQKIRVTNGPKGSAVSLELV